MPNGKTQNYGLSQWIKSDQVLMEDFNKDNKTIDEALKAVDVRVDGKADVSALEGLAATVSALSGTVSGQGNTLAAKGNCQIVTTSYEGKGGYGQSTPCSLTFSAQPLLVIVLNQGGYPLIMIRPQTSASLNGAVIFVSWSSKGVSWYNTNYEATQLNTKNVTYHALALLSLS